MAIYITILQIPAVNIMDNYFLKFNNVKKINLWSNVLDFVQLIIIYKIE